jgi:pyruvate formate lyase activating enzyme
MPSAGSLLKPPSRRSLDAASIPPPLRVGGIVPFTTIDFPGALAAVVFCQGCPWRCGYCHNPHLLPARGAAAVEFGTVLDWLGDRRGLLDAVVFSGGEPTAQPVLVPALCAVRELGFRVGLHTGGAYPRRLARVLHHIDWVGIDVKAPWRRYARVTGVADSGKAALASLDLVLDRGVAYEVRTTIHPALTSPADLEELADALAARGVARWILQPFRPDGCADAASAAASRTAAMIDEALLRRLARRLAVEVRA